MKRLTILALLVLSMILSIPASQADAKDKLTKAEAKALMSEMLKGQDIAINVMKIIPTPIDGLWSFSVMIQGQPFVIYTGAKGENVILPPKGLQSYLLNPRTGQVFTKDTLDEMSKVDFSSIPLDDALILGDKKAAIKVAVFDDPY